MSEIRNLTRNGETFYPLTTSSAVINEATGEGLIIDDEPTAGSENLIKSGGVAKRIKVEFLFRGYIADNNGKFVPQPSDAYGFVCTDFIPVENGNVIIVFGKQDSADFVSCYDNAKHYVSRIDSSDPSNFVMNSITINSDTIKYVRFCSVRPTGTNVPVAYFENANNVISILNGIKNSIFDFTGSHSIDINGYIDENGIFHENVSWKSTDYIPIYKGDTCNVFVRGELNNTSAIALYDAGKNVVSVIVADVSAYKKYQLTINDESVRYFRTCTLYEGAGNTLPNWFVLTSETKTRIMLNLLENRLDNEDLTDIPFNTNGYISETGEFHATPSFKSTDYVPVFEGLQYKIKAFGEANNTSVVAFYDRNKNVISNIITSITNYEEISDFVPSGAAYMRTCCWPQYVSNCYCKVERIHNIEEDIINALRPKGYKYGSNIRKPYNLSNKHFVAFGDSITAGTYSYDGGMDDTITDAYITILANKLGVNFTFATDNKAQGGTGFCYYPSQYQGKQKITDVILNFTGEADVIYIAGGTNDYQMNSPVGQLDDTTIDTVYGALYLICEYLKTNYPNAIVFFATPINWSNGKGGILYDINQYRNAIFEVATMYGYNVVDCSTFAFPDVLEGVANPLFKNAMIYDGIHPTLLGHRYMGDNIASLLL